MTVSRVVNGEANVRDTTREKVNRADRRAELHRPTRPRAAWRARELIRIAILYSNPSAGYLNELLVGVLNRASLGHLQLVVEKCEEGEHEESARPHRQRHRRHHPAAAALRFA